MLSSVALSGYRCRGARGRLTRTIPAGAILGQGDRTVGQLEEDNDQGPRIGEWVARSETELLAIFTP